MCSFHQHCINKTEQKKIHENKFSLNGGNFQEQISVEKVSPQKNIFSSGLVSSAVLWEVWVSLLCGIKVKKYNSETPTII